jgi:hypothetical protein
MPTSTMSQDLFSFQQFIIGLLQLSSRHRSDWDPEEIASLLHQITGREFQYAPPSASATSSSEKNPASETPDKSPSPQHPDSPTPSPPSSQTTMFMDEIVKHQSSSTITQQAESTAHHISATSKTLHQDAINNATFPMSVSEMVRCSAFEWVSRSSFCGTQKPLTLFLTTRSMRIYCSSALMRDFHFPRRYPDRNNENKF